MNIVVSYGMFDVIIENGRIIDGTGNVWYKADIGIKGQTIVKIGDLTDVSCSNKIDAGKHIVAPGFIDTHSHSDLKLLETPEIKQKIMQGITTEVIGQDGLSIYPLSDETRDSMRKRVSGLLGKVDFKFRWNSLSEYFEQLENNGVGTNVVALVPHGNIRALYLGFDDREPTQEEVRLMKKKLGHLLEQGAAGMSTGLIYPPCSYAEKDELIALCKTVKSHGGIFVTHMRNEGDRLLSAMDEMIDVADKSGAPLHISHFKALFKQNWGKSKKSLKKLQKARNHDIEVTFDQYPYIAGSTMLDAILPPWVIEGGTEKMLERLQDEETRQKIKHEILEGEGEGWTNQYMGCGPGGIMISSVESEENKDLEGKTLKELAEETQKEPLEIAFDVLVKEEGAVSMIDFYGSEQDVQRIMQHKAGMACTDGILSGTPHPRTYGAMPRILRKYVREKNLLSIVSAIRRMTSFPARRLGLFDRGILSEGMKADIVVFDKKKVKDTATYENPIQFPEGFHYVFVNGTIAVKQGKPTEKLAGEVIRT